VKTLSLKFRVSTIQLSPIGPADPNGSTYGVGKRVTLTLVDTVETSPALAESPRGEVHIGPLSPEASALFEQGLVCKVTLATSAEE
jgi:hypothetical protein